MPRVHRRTRVVTATTACLLLGLSGLATASESSTTVSTQASESSRQLEVLDLSGNDLEELRLRHGRPQPFEVRVTDTDQDPENGFHVDTTMNNLHLLDGDTHVGEHLASENVALSFPGNALGAADVDVNLEPRYLVSTAGELTCDTTDLACDLLGTLGGILSLLGLGSTPDEVSFEGVELIGSLVDDIDLSSLGLDALPLGIGHGDGGTFDDPECGAGIGASFCDDGAPAATSLQALRGANDGLHEDLEALLQELLGDLDGPLVGDGGVFDLADVLATLSTADDVDLIGDGSVVGEVSDLGQALLDYTETEQIALINEILEATLVDLGLGDLMELSGRYSSYPALTVHTDSAPAGGEYEGTLVVTLIE